MARQDTAKTATEIDAAETQGARLESTQVALFADTILDAYSTMYEVGKSQALAGLIIFAPPEILLKEYQISPSGDVEVIKRKEKLQLMKEFFEILANTAAGPVLVEYLVRNAFPEEADTLLEAMRAGNNISQEQTSAVISALVEALQQIMPTLPPNEQADLTNIINAAQQLVGASGNTNGAPQPQTVPGQPPAQGNGGIVQQ
jgi:hypothetical protein